jgi:trans-L-3-hydroxyproline dehydratase
VEIRTVEMHTAGEPVRIVVDGLPPIPGATILEKRRHAMEHLDGLRRALMAEPRGHAFRTGTSSFTSDDDDPLRRGFLLR